MSPALRSVAAAVFATLLVGCGLASTEESPSAGPSASPSASPTAAATPTQAPTEPPAEPRALPRGEHAPPGEYAVGRTDLRLIDRSRTTDTGADEEPRPGRRIGVRLLYPTAGEGGSTVADDAEPLPGPFPAFVFSHGLGGDGAAYEEVIALVAAAGYVVVAPTFPLSSGPGASFLDVVNQPEDVSFVLDSLLEGPEAFPAIDPDRIAAGGHSLGAVTSFGLGYHSRLRDDRLDAVVGYSGAQFDLGAGDYTDRPATPLLLVHGAGDTVLPIGGSEEVFAAGTGPVDLLRLPESGHVDLFFAEAGALVVEATLAFLDAHLGDDRSALEAMPARAEDSGLGVWESRG